MARFLKDRSSAIGHAPGSLILIGNKKVEVPSIRAMQYNETAFSELSVDSIEKAFHLINSQTVTWIDIYGLHDIEIIQKVGELFNLPALLLENIVNTDLRPKYEDGDTYDAFIVKMLHQKPKSDIIEAEQISMILGENYVLTLQERKGDVFSPVRDRIRNKKGRICRKKNDYLTYSLLDTIVDNYMLLIENIGSKVEDLEDRIFLKKDINLSEDIYVYKTELNFLRKAVRPVKDLMVYLLKSENSFFNEDNQKYLSHLNDLVTQSTDAIELYNNLLSDQLNIYNTNVNNRLNEVMKVLTIFASIFIPLTFLAGIYGMNFEYIPELSFKYAYPIFWLVSLSIGFSLLYYFRKNKWL
jgi:magnesium transporter